MKSFSRWILTVAVTTLTVVGALGIGSAFAQTPESSDPAVEEAAPAEQGRRGYEFRGQRGVRGDDGASLAEALGVTVEELQAAQLAAHNVAVEQALAEGLITQEQADRLLANESGRFNGRFGVRGSEIDGEALLASELGITVETLDAAREQVRQAALDAAIADGTITQEQADLMTAAQVLRERIDKDAILAEILGVSVDELEAVERDREAMQALLDDAGLDRAAVSEAMQAAYLAELDAAVADGTITQAQADQLLSGEGRQGFGGRRNHRGPRGNGNGLQGPVLESDDA